MGRNWRSNEYEILDGPCGELLKRQSVASEDDNVTSDKRQNDASMPSESPRNCIQTTVSTESSNDDGSQPPVTGADVRFDVNLDGSIDLIDMALVKNLNGGSASCP